PRIYVKRRRGFLVPEILHVSAVVSCQYSDSRWFVRRRPLLTSSCHTSSDTGHSCSLVGGGGFTLD
ncbi:hypothetical protein J6590_091708, partial [Homalodisca vitripennis]